MTEDFANFLVRPAEISDSQRIWEIRNSPMVRQHSKNQDEIKFSDHQNWFQQQYFGNTGNLCFVLANAEGIVIGYCRFDFNQPNKNYRVSIALDPQYQGRGLGHWLLSQSLKNIPSQSIVLAEIKKTNPASLKLFEKNNFKTYQSDEFNFYLKYARE